MDRLKDYIQQNREAFDEIPLPEGHLERFAARLENETAAQDGDMSGNGVDADA